MKTISAAALVGAATAAVANAAKTETSLSPISRVVELMEGLAKTAESEGKAEEKLYNKFVCWAKTVINTKTASNAAANTKIQELETYIADIEAGRIEFTSERTDLEKELAEVTAAIEEATSLRKKEEEEFLAAEDEMTKAVTALDEAILVLKEATANHKEGVFLETTNGMGYAARADKSALLEKAADLGSRVLTKGDALFLRRLLTGEVPERADWKTLNRKADFKNKYKARSFKIQDLLKELQEKISTDLADAKAKEEAAKAEFDKLLEAKTDEKEKTEQALQDMSKENGARDMNKDEAQAEVDALKEQVANDEKYIKQTEESLAEKKEEWKDRQKLRAEEIAAIEKAISILHSDDARDNFKKSLSSQGYLFLQVDAKRTLAQKAADALRNSAQSNSRMKALATMVAHSGSHFDQVIKAIDEMIVVLKEEETSDLEIKEKCESDRAANTRAAATASRTMDELTDGISTLTAEIAQIVQQIADKNQAIADTEKQLEEATQNRADEKRDYETSASEDKLALETVGKAKDVLAGFYADNNLMLLQQPAGEAPPPPPTTWDAPYGGKTAESTSIIAILEMVMEDITKDIAKAKKAEETAQAEFDTFKAESEEMIGSLGDDISTLTGTKGEKEDEVTQKTEERTTEHSELDAVMKTIADAKPGCDFFAINYPMRLKNRQIELDGLDKAKAILSGGSFNAAPDPNREMKPGDAFLVRRHKF